MSITRIDGWMTSDGKLHKTEEYAIQHQKYLYVKKGIQKILEDNMSNPDGQMNVHLASFLLTENRQELYELLKKNL
jgi:hypothetical protein